MCSSFLPGTEKYEAKSYEDGILLQILSLVQPLKKDSNMYLALIAFLPNKQECECQSTDTENQYHALPYSKNLYAEFHRQDLQKAKEPRKSSWPL